jgi:phospholipid/cholesterol/gamma-HCH transport system permease protein
MGSDKTSAKPNADVQVHDDELRIILSGQWRLGTALPDAAPVLEELSAARTIRRVCFDATALASWDSTLLTFLVQTIDRSREQHLKVDRGGLPQGVQRLLRLAYAVPEQPDSPQGQTLSWIGRVGAGALRNWDGAVQMVGFVGELSIALARLLCGRADLRITDLADMIHEAGPRALPIVSLISLLVGLILAFVGAVQLRMFGAQIYVADLVALGMTREMGAMMTAVILAGRTGAAFAAQLGSMQVNEEIDALRTLGISPIEFLVLPRVLALVVMTPMLCLYADFMGILGGMLVAVSMMDMSLLSYLQETREALALTDLATGLFKSLVFGLLVAYAGCLRGMQSGRSSAAVGEATTSAVVTGIVLIVVSDAILTVIYDVLRV